jgi:hypothetical protein
VDGLHDGAHGVDDKFRLVELDEVPAPGGDRVDAPGQPAEQVGDQLRAAAPERFGRFGRPVARERQAPGGQDRHR